MGKPSAADARTARFWGGFCSSAAWANGKSPAPQVRGTHQFYGITCQAEPYLNWDSRRFIFQENKLKYCGQLCLHELLNKTLRNCICEIEGNLQDHLGRPQGVSYPNVCVYVHCGGGDWFLFYILYYTTTMMSCCVHAQGFFYLWEAAP